MPSAVNVADAIAVITKAVAVNAFGVRGGHTLEHRIPPWLSLTVVFDVPVVAVGTVQYLVLAWGSISFRRIA